MKKTVDNNFWHSKWKDNQLGFHQEKVNSRLVKFWPELDIPGVSKVFVPLCGKSLDMIWLADFHSVLGVELSNIAAEGFYSENNLPVTKNDQPPFVCYSGNSIDLLCGDVFDLSAEQMVDVGGVFDRAALIALPPDLRARYARHLASILTTGCKILLITMIYDEGKMSGPPFSVKEEEVRGLFETQFSVNKISESSGPDIVGNLRERGLETLTEQVFKLTKN